MKGFLLLAPTGSGKSWTQKNDPLFREGSIDGDSLINWNFDWENTIWQIKDREHLDIVLKAMRGTGKCVCWYVGTTAVADALDDGRLSRQEVGVILLPEEDHRNFVESRDKKGHSWTRAIEHRDLCHELVRNYNLPQFSSFEQAAEYLKNQSV